MSTAVQVTLIIIGGLIVVSLIGAAVAISLFNRVNRMQRDALSSFNQFTADADQKYEEAAAKMNREHEARVARIRGRR